MKYLQNPLKLLTETQKKGYYPSISKKLMSPMTSGKTYWSILKALLSNQIISCISTPLLHQNQNAADSKKKAELFNCFLLNINLS